MVQSVVNGLFIIETFFIIWLFWGLWDESREVRLIAEWETKDHWYEEEWGAKKNITKSKDATKSQAVAKKRGRPAGVKNGQGQKTTKARAKVSPATNQSS